jgi:hypothetical protein
MHAQIVVEDKELSPDEVSFEAPLLGYRKDSEEVFTGPRWKDVSGEVQANAKWAYGGLGDLTPGDGIDVADTLWKHKYFNKYHTALALTKDQTNSIWIFGGFASFGRPLVTTAEEEKLVIPKSIAAEGDIYMVKFAVSFRFEEALIRIEDIQRLAFSVTGPVEILALELIPLRFDREMSITKIASSPEIKVQHGPNAMEIGKVYEQQIVYKILKPTIVAEGLQESAFAWSMADEAVQLGAKRFIAILQVPKGTKSITVQFQASAITKSSWMAQGNIISTAPESREIQLP